MGGAGGTRDASRGAAHDGVPRADWLGRRRLARGDAIRGVQPRAPLRPMSAHVDGAIAVREIADIAPKLAALTAEGVFGDIWERPGLSQRDRSLITVAALVALYRTEQLPGHLRRALDNGLTRDEIVEAITHLAFYTGWPNAFTAITLAKPIFDLAPTT